MDALPAADTSSPDDRSSARGQHGARGVQIARELYHDAGTPFLLLSSEGPAAPAVKVSIARRSDLVLVSSLR